MSLPFTPLQFFDVFEQYNETVWPAQILIYILALIVFYNILKPGKYSNKIISTILAFLWLWMGVVYHWSFFASINAAARLFALLFVIEGAILSYEGIVKSRLAFSFDKKSRQDLIGVSLLIFGTVIYPLLGYALGHAFPDAPTFGLPCPTTIFTFGALLLTRNIPRYVAMIPFLWSLLGFMAALSLGVKEDIFLLLAGLIGARYILFSARISTER